MMQTVLFELKNWAEKSTRKQNKTTNQNTHKNPILIVILTLKNKEKRKWKIKMMDIFGPQLRNIESIQFNGNKKHSNF